MQKTNPVWHKNSRILEKFYREKGRWPERNERYGGLRVGQWLYRMRFSHFQGNLSPDKYKRLVELGYEFKPLATPPSFDKNFEHLVAYRKKHPHKWPVKETIFPPGVHLGRWCEWLRKKFTRGTLEMKYQKRLRAIGYPLTKIMPWGHRWDQHFERRLQYLKQYRIKHPKGWPGRQTEFPEGNPLGSWCRHLRDEKKSLPAHWVKKLDSIGFPWNLREARWDENYKWVEDYLKKHKHLPKFSKHASKRETGIYGWIRTQNTALKRGGMPEKKRRLLKKLGITREAPV